MLLGKLGNIFKQNNIDRYWDKPDIKFMSSKYSVLEMFCFANFILNYALISKNEGTEFRDECQLDILPDELLEQNHHPCENLKRVPLMNSKEKLKCHKVYRTCRYLCA